MVALPFRICAEKHGLGQRPLAAILFQDARISTGEKVSWRARDLSLQ
jgi:hypothetical protein